MNFNIESFEKEIKETTIDDFPPERKKQVKRHFIVKMWTTYSIYTYLLLLLMIGVIILPIILVNVLTVSYRYYFLFILVGVIPCLFFIIKMLTTIPEKYRFYLFICGELEKEGYSDFYFRSYMQAACYQIIIKDVLKQYGFGNEYPALYRNFSTEYRYHRYIENELASHFKDEDEKKEEK